MRAQAGTYEDYLKAQIANAGALASPALKEKLRLYRLGQMAQPLLECLKDLVEHGESFEHISAPISMLERARELIAKAEAL